MSTLVRKSIADVTHWKLRTLLAVLSISIGVLGLTAVNLASDSIGQAFAYTRDQSAVPDLVFQLGNYQPDLTRQIAALPNVGQLQTRVEATTRWEISGGSGLVGLQILGYDDFSHIALQPLQITSGRLPAADDEVVMESSDRIYQPIAPGDTIMVQRSAQQSIALHVVGLGRTRGLDGLQQQPGQALAYMTSQALRQLGHGSVTGIITKGNKTSARLLTGLEIQVKNMNRVGQTGDTIKNFLQQQQVFIAGYDDMNYSYAGETVAGVLNIVRVLSLVALLLSCILIIQSISALISEQTHIIGTMKALGGTRWRIMLSYLLSVGIYSVLGTLCGIVLGLGAGWLLGEQLAGLVALDTGPFQVSPLIVLMSVAVGLLIPPLAALLPLWIGTRITVYQAISAYGVTGALQPKSYRAFGRHLTWVPQTVWLGLRDLFRKPGRTALILLALFCSSITFTAVQINNTSVNDTANRVNNAFLTDVELYLSWLNLDNYLAMQTQLQVIPNVAYVEPLYASGDFSVNQQHIPIWGMLAHTRIYPYHLSAGRWFHDGEQNVIVLGQQAAQNLHAQVGTTLEIHSADSGNSASWRVVGIVDDLNQNDVSLGEAGTPGSAYAPLDAQAALAGTHGIHYLLIAARDRSPAAIDQMAKKINSYLLASGNYGAVTTHQEIAADFQGPGSIVGLILDAIVIIVALVAVLGLLNLLLITVLERRSEIGILRSLGATGGRVAIIFLLESLILVLFAWLIGTVIGIPGGYALLQIFSQLLMRFQFVLHPLSLLLTLAFALLVTLVASIGPALSASHLRIRDILRYE